VCPQLEILTDHAQPWVNWPVSPRPEQVRTHAYLPAFLASRPPTLIDQLGTPSIIVAQRPSHFKQTRLQ
jgi:hypothetical protein